MSEIVRPPDAWWVNVPWWAGLVFFLLALIVVVVIGPWMIARARGRPSAMLSREQALATQEADLRKRQDVERLRMEADRDRGWDIARGWMAVAHPLWHDLCGARQAHNSLLVLCQRMLEGRMPPEAARDRLSEFEPLPKPTALPDMEMVQPRRPGETKYA